MTERIAIVGMACLYPDADSPAELWENVLAKRRSFRRIPPERLRLEDYFSTDPQVPDSTYSAHGAFIEGYKFSRSHFRVARGTFCSTDLAHWIALDIAEKALKDAGFLQDYSLPRQSTAVIVGNTLTGDLSRANSLRLRWPYVKRTVEAALSRRKWTILERKRFLDELEVRYKEPFAQVGEDTLAGGLANTIAGRICNHFDLGGGGYTVDGACCSSLLAVAHGCSALEAGEIDAAVVGGVDVSVDPFELIGFAKTVALATDDMRVYDARAEGFWPGEGCGFAVLVRHADAVVQRMRVYALISGWGISSDGSGGLTRPKEKGQRLALDRAYGRAGFGIETVHLFEGHGTATPVGDAVELRALSAARAESGDHVPPAVVGSIKGNIGHTKAAAGIAGLIKVTLAVQNQILPATAGCVIPTDQLLGDSRKLRVLTEAEVWPRERPLRAGVSSMGFGGINTHVAIEGVAAERRTSLSIRDVQLDSSPQEAEVFFFGARSMRELLDQIDRILRFAARLSLGELADLASHLAKTVGDRNARAAVVAAKPAELASSLQDLSLSVRSGIEKRLDVNSGIFLGSDCCAPRIAFLFPGQGSSLSSVESCWQRRFPIVSNMYGSLPNRSADELRSPALVQSTIVASSIAGLHVLRELGVVACVAVGHSLGELTALHWAGVVSQASAVRIAIARGDAMSDFCDAPGTMASISATRDEIESFLGRVGIAIACVNGPKQTVISGKVGMVEQAVARAEARGWQCTRLPVTHAFHSPLMADALPKLKEALSREEFSRLERPVVSTVTGMLLSSGEDIRDLLCRQLTSPVLFEQAMSVIAEKADMLIEVGPGKVLSGLAREMLDGVAVATDAGGASLIGLLKVLASAYVLGAPVNHEKLFEGRVTRRFDLNWNPSFFSSPCEVVSLGDEPLPDLPYPNLAQSEGEEEASAEGISYGAHSSSEDTLGTVKSIVAEFTELLVSRIRDEDRLSDDLHLNSITVTQIVGRVAHQFDLPMPSEATEYANATISALAQAFDRLRSTGASRRGVDAKNCVSGIGSWTRSFVMDLAESPLRQVQAISIPGASRVIAPDGHPLAEALRHKLSMRSESGGAVFCVLPESDESGELCVDLLLEATRALIETNEPTRFVLVQQGRGAASFARCVHLEITDLITCVVNVPFTNPLAVDWVLAEAFSAVDYSEAHYDSEGNRREPRLRTCPIADEEAPLPLGPTDVLLVTGGGKGITAECALAIARETGVRLALMGRSSPENDPELASNLERLRTSGVAFRYFVIDLTEIGEVQKAITEIRNSFGAVTGLLHGAGSNTPQPLSALNRSSFVKTLATKVQSLRNLLAFIVPSDLKLLLTFGSLIARTGMRGEADYAVANEWLTALTVQWQSENPHCRCLAVEWSVWSGIGMAERMGRLEALAQQGITPITPEKGVFLLRQLLTHRVPVVPVVVTGRFGETKTLKIESKTLPLLRFLEQPRVYYPGVELVADSQLSPDTDPYLNDHIFQGSRLLPAVMGLEAMAQAASALVNSTGMLVFENVRFSKPIVVADATPMTIRVAAVALSSNCVNVVVRSSESDFQIDHFSATCRFEDIRDLGPTELFKNGSNLPRVPLSPARDLYGQLLFQSGRFCRLSGYRHLAAKGCIAEIGIAGDGNPEAAYFARYLPSNLVTGDLSARDAVMHSVQACVPDSVLLPVELGRISIFKTDKTNARIVHAVEQSREKETYIYSIDVTDADGILVEQWRQIKFRNIRRSHGGSYGATGINWSESLLGPYIERVIEDLYGRVNVSVIVSRDALVERRLRCDEAIQRIFGRTVRVTHGSSGKPEVSGDRDVSVSYSGQITMVVAGSGIVGCDVETVTKRPIEVWQDLLGQERIGLAKQVAKEVREDFNVSSTRLWAAGECQKKSGTLMSAPLALASTELPGWVVFSSEKAGIATFMASIDGAQSGIVLSVLVGTHNGYL
jgi:enediyne polyketide synthase